MIGDNIEAGKIMEHTGNMTTAIMERKLVEIHKKRAELKNEAERLMTILRERKYHAMTMEEIGAIWDGPEDEDDCGAAAERRQAMAYELPYLQDDFETFLFEHYMSMESLNSEVFGCKWNDMGNSPLDVRPYFEGFCKK